MADGDGPRVVDAAADSDTDTPGTAVPEGARPRSEDTGTGPVNTLVDALWRAPSELPRSLPERPDGQESAAWFGGVCAAVAARRGRPVGRIRLLFIVCLLPAVLYPVLWSVHAAGRPGTLGRPAGTRLVILPIVAVLTGVGTMLVLGEQGISGPVTALAGAATGAPLLLLVRSPLLVWRLMTAAMAVSALLPRRDVFAVPLGATPPAVPAEAGFAANTVVGAALPAYLLVLYLVGRQYGRRITTTVGAVTAALYAVPVLLVTGTDSAAQLWTAAAAVIVLVIGDNVRRRREEQGRVRIYRSPPSAPRPATESSTLVTAADGVVDAVWRAPVRRPGGPIRLLHGPRRPLRGRLIGGVCAALAGDSRPLRIVLRVAAVLLGPGTAVLFYPVLWLLLPSESDPRPRAVEDDPEPPVVLREHIAWGLLIILAGLAALGAGGQLSEFHHLPMATSVLLGAACGAPLALVPTAPLLAWRVEASVVAVTVAVVGGAATPINDFWPWTAASLVVMAVVLYAVAASYPGRLSAGAAVVTGTACFFSAIVLTGVPFWQPLWTTGLAVAIVVVGGSVRGRRSAQRELARESELRRRDQERKAAAEERSRIARELHDVVSHHMSMIAIQAEAAPYKYPDLPDGAAETFIAIRDASRGALTEMRRVVGLLRAQEEPAERAPQPDLDMLPDLVDGARQAGMRVDLDDRSTEARFPDAVGRSAYRIVQEALSNAARHAQGSAVRVRLSPSGPDLEVLVENGPPPDALAAPRAESRPSSPGHGLVGMRERASVLGGSLEAAPTPEGGYRVRALLPAAE